MKKLLIGIMIVLLLTFVCFAEDIDEAYIFTPEELVSWTYSGGTATVKDGYLSVVPNAGTNNMMIYSAPLNLEAEYIDGMTIVMEVITKDGSTLTGNGMPIYTIINDDTTYSEAHKAHASAWSYASGVKKTYNIDLRNNFAYWADAVTLNKVRIDPTYSGTSVSEIKIYEVSFTPGKPYVKPAELVPGLNVFTGTDKAFNFEDQTDASYFTLNGTANVSYNVVDDPTGSGRGKVLEMALLNTSAVVYHDFSKTFDFEIDRPVYVAFEGQGKSQPAFWLGVSPGIHIGTVSESWSVISKDNTSASPARLQYATGTNYSVKHYLDNYVVIPYYKVTYTLEYPDGTMGTNVEKTYFDASQIAIAKDGTITGLPESYSIEDIGATYAGYDLIGWSTVKGATTPMSTVELNNEDVVLYPVWQEKDQMPINLTLYFDENRTVTKTEQVYTSSNYTLPDYSELFAYTPDGEIPLGFDVNGTIYAPGKQIIIPEVSSLTIYAVYGQPEHSEYGELVFLETFESLNLGTHIYNSATGESTPTNVSYINPNWSDKADHFYLRKGDSGYNLRVVSDGDTNQVLEVTRTPSLVWPNLYAYNNDTTSIPDGHYTVCADFIVPESEAANIQNFNLRIYYNGTSSLTKSVTVSAADAGKTIHLSFDLPVAKGTANTMINYMQIFATTSSGDSDTFFYVDNISLYYKKAYADIKISETVTDKIFFIPGETITLPDSYNVYKYIPDGYTLAGFDYNGTLYEPASEYTTTALDSALTFTADYEEKEFALKFETGNANGTIADIEVLDGDKVTLPDSGIYHPTLTLSGWKIRGTETIFNAGAEFTFDYSSNKKYLDGTDRLVFTPVFTGYDNTSYGFGASFTFPETNDTDSVTLSTLVNIADKLYYGVRRVTSPNTTDNAKFADMVAKGVVPAYSDTSAVALFEDAATVLANALPYSYYNELCFDIKVDANDEALKLVRAGIFNESVDFSKEITYDELAIAVQKLVDKDLRSVENKRTLYILGDSLCAIYPEASTTLGWPKYLPLNLNGNLDIVNHAIPGIDTRIYFSITASASQEYKSIMENINKGDYVIIALGTNDSTLWGNGSMTYESSRDNYYRMINEIRANGGIPFMVCPVGRNRTDDNGNYIESDPLIIECMNDVNEVYSANAPIINFKEISLDRMSDMTAEQRAKIYNDDVHYTAYGAEVVAGWFAELMVASDNIQLSAFRNHFKIEEPEIAKTVVIELAEKESETNIRFAEIDGYQYQIEENNNTYTVYVEKDTLVEIVEKTSTDSVNVVSSKYYLIDYETLTYKELPIDALSVMTSTKSIRAEDPMGVRFKANFSKAAKTEETAYEVEEYGFIIATQDSLDKAGAQLNFDFAKHVTGVAYNKADGINIFFNDDDDDWCVITGVLMNIPAKQYQTVLTAKMYTKINIDGQVFTVYSEPTSASVYEVAKSLIESGATLTSEQRKEIVKIISYVEGNIFVDIGGLYK